MRGHERAVVALTFRADETHILSASADRTVREWDATFTPEKLTVLRKHEERVRSVVFSPDPGAPGRLASGSSDNTVRLWDSATGEQLRVLRGHEDQVVTVAFSPDPGAPGRLASASEDHTVRVWDAFTGKQLHELKGHRNIVRWVAFSPDPGAPGRLASASDDRTVRTWDPGTGTEAAAPLVHDSAVKCVAFSPGGAWLASGTTSGVLRLWDAATAEELPALEGHDRHDEAVQCLRFSLDGRYLASAAGSGVRIWDLSTRELVHLWPAAAGASSVAFLPAEDSPGRSGTRLATGHSDGTVRIWSLTTGEEVLVLRGHEDAVNSVVFSPDPGAPGLLASGADDKTVRIWDTVPFRERYEQRRKIIAARPAAKRMVDTLHARFNDWHSVAEQLRSDTELDQDVRHAALNEVLRRATNHLEP